MGEHLGWSTSCFILPFILKVHSAGGYAHLHSLPTSGSQTGWTLMNATAAFIFQSRLSPEGPVDEFVEAVRRLALTLTPLCCFASYL